MTLLALSDPGAADVTRAGGKGASLASMIARGWRVPPGFVVTAETLEECTDGEQLRAAAHGLDHEQASGLVLAAEPPREEIASAYADLGADKVAVRSSACAEDSEAASYAGQQDTFLGVVGADEVCQRVIDCWGSFFSERALFYRSQKGSLDDLAIAVVVQRMVDPDKAGVIFTADPVQRRRDRMIVEAVHGLGEQVVSGEVTPDHYVIDRKGALKRDRLVGEGVLTDDELTELAQLGVELEEHFGAPQDIEWAIADGLVFLLQSRPVTTL